MSLAIVSKPIATVGTGVLGHACEMLLCSLCWYVEKRRCFGMRLKKKDQRNKQETHCILWQIKVSEHGPNPESYSLVPRAFFRDTGLNPFSHTKPQLSWTTIATTEPLNRKQHLLPSLMYFAEPTFRTTEGRAQELGQAEKPGLYE